MMSKLLYLYNSINRGDVVSLTDSLECRKDKIDINVILPNYGVGILHLAVGIEPFDVSAQCLEVILRNGGDPNLRSDEGLTPVHIAANWGRIDNLKVLLAWGGDISIRDADQKTPYNYAVEEGHWEIRDYLLKIAENEFDDVERESPQLISALEKNLVISGDGIVTEYDKLYKYNRKKSQECLRNSEMVRDWCNQNLPPHNTHYSLCNEHSLLENELSLWNSKLISINSTDSSISQISSTEKCDNSLSISIECVADRNIPRETQNCKELSGIDKIEFSCNSDNAIYSCLYSRNDKIDNNTKVDVMRQSLFEQFSLPGSPTNIVHKNYLNKSCIKKICSTNDKNGTSLNMSDKDLEIEENSNEDINKVVDIEGNSTILNNKEFSVDEMHRCAIVPSKTNEVNPRASLLKVSDECSHKNTVDGTEEPHYTQVLLEKHLATHDKKLATTPTELANVSSSTDGKSSAASSLPASLDYDLGTLRLELTQCGYNPGPINHSTKRLYLKKLRNLKRNPLVTQNAAGKTYSVELQKTLSEGGWSEMAWRQAGGTLERTAAADFARRGAAWREGEARTSFTYLLLDPRVTRDLPVRALQQPEPLVWQTFVDSIFYVGKGKRSRPYSHLYQAIGLWKQDSKQRQMVNKKVQHILDVWMSGSGVVCLHVFQNVIPAEAYTYEAAMIDVLGLTNLKNLKTGNYYGVVSSWPLKDRRRLGVFLLYKAMQIFLSEGERQLRPEDLD